MCTVYNVRKYILIHKLRSEEEEKHINNLNKDISDLMQVYDEKQLKDIDSSHPAMLHLPTNKGDS